MDPTEDQIRQIHQNVAHPLFNKNNNFHNTYNNVNKNAKSAQNDKLDYNTTPFINPNNFQDYSIPFIPFYPMMLSELPQQAQNQMMGGTPIQNSRNNYLYGTSFPRLLSSPLTPLNSLPFLISPSLTPTPPPIFLTGPQIFPTPPIPYPTSFYTQSLAFSPKMNQSLVTGGNGKISSYQSNQEQQYVPVFRGDLISLYPSSAILVSNPSSNMCIGPPPNYNSTFLARKEFIEKNLTQVLAPHMQVYNEANYNNLQKDINYLLSPFEENSFASEYRNCNNPTQICGDNYQNKRYIRNDTITKTPFEIERSHLPPYGLETTNARIQNYATNINASPLQNFHKELQNEICISLPPLKYKNKYSNITKPSQSGLYEWIPPGEEVQKLIVDRIENMFTDDYLLRDTFMLKHILRNKEGYVNLKLLSALRKIKRLTQDWQDVLYSIQKRSKTLMINKECTKVKRLNMPHLWNVKFDNSRLVMGYNVPITDSDVLVSLIRHIVNMNNEGDIGKNSKFGMQATHSQGDAVWYKLFMAGSNMPNDTFNFLNQFHCETMANFVIVEYPTVIEAERAATILNIKYGRNSSSICMTGSDTAIWFRTIPHILAKNLKSDMLHIKPSSQSSKDCTSALQSVTYEHQIPSIAQQNIRDDSGFVNMSSGRSSFHTGSLNSSDSSRNSFFVLRHDENKPYYPSERIRAEDMNPTWNNVHNKFRSTPEGHWEIENSGIFFKESSNISVTTSINKDFRDRSSTINVASFIHNIREDKTSLHNTPNHFHSSTDYIPILGRSFQSQMDKTSQRTSAIINRNIYSFKDISNPLHMVDHTMMNTLDENTTNLQKKKYSLPTQYSIIGQNKYKELPYELNLNVGSNISQINLPPRLNYQRKSDPTHDKLKPIRYFDLNESDSPFGSSDAPIFPYRLSKIERYNRQISKITVSNNSTFQNSYPGTFNYEPNCKTQSPKAKLLVNKKSIDFIKYFSDYRLQVSSQENMNNDHMGSFNKKNPDHTLRNANVSTIHPPSIPSYYNTTSPYFTNLNNFDASIWSPKDFTSKCILYNSNPSLDIYSCHVKSSRCQKLVNSDNKNNDNQSDFYTNLGPSNPQMSSLTSNLIITLKRSPKEPLGDDKGFYDTDKTMRA
ncbi:unnamed protein product [Gordionus sp. m RMFG-2023]